MFVFNYVDNCTFNHSNGSHHQSPPEVTVLSPGSLIQNSLLLVLGFFAFASNALALLILFRPRAKTRMGSSIRFSLSLLSSAEIALSLFTMINSINAFAEINDERFVIAAIYSTIVFWNLNALICSRNWFVALIAFSRCEAVSRPMESLSGNHFSTKRLKRYAVFFLFFSYAISLVRNFAKVGVICRENGHIDFNQLLLKYKEYHYFEAYGFFAYQCILPILTIFISTLFLIYVLVHSRPMQGQVNCQNRQGTQRKATRTVLVLAIVFTAMEFPIFLINLLGLAQLIAPRSSVKTYLLFCGRILAILDSSCNVFIYVLTSDRFRIEFLCLLKEIRHCGRRPSGYRCPYQTAAELVHTQPQMVQMLKRVGGSSDEICNSSS